MLHKIRAERHIRPPVIRCSRCGHVGEAAEPDVSVRAMILSLGRFGMVAPDQVKALEQRWAALRKQNGLDLYGRTAKTEAPTCAHSDTSRYGSSRTRAPVLTGNRTFVFTFRLMRIRGAIWTEDTYDADFA